MITIFQRKSVICRHRGKRARVVSTAADNQPGAFLQCFYNRLMSHLRYDTARFIEPFFRQLFYKVSQFFGFSFFHFFFDNGFGNICPYHYGLQRLQMMFLYNGSDNAQRTFHMNASSGASRRTDNGRNFRPGSRRYNQFQISSAGFVADDCNTLSELMRPCVRTPGIYYDCIRFFFHTIHERLFGKSVPQNSAWRQNFHFFHIHDRAFPYNFLLFLSIC